MATKVSEVRQAVATRISGLTGWSEDAAPIDIFGRGPRPLRNLLYAVGVGQTENAQGVRDKAGSIIFVGTTVVVRFAYAMSPKDLKTSFDSALDAEDALIARLMAYDGSWPGALQVLYDSSNRQYGDEYTTIDVNFTVLHNLQI